MCQILIVFVRLFVQEEGLEIAGGTLQLLLGDVGVLYQELNYLVDGLELREFGLFNQIRQPLLFALRAYELFVR